MFGSDIIRIKINGYLKNNNENEIIYFKEKGIRNKNKMSFIFDNVKYSIKFSNDNVMMIRDGNDFVNSFSFNKENGKSSYYLKEHGYSVDMNIITKCFNVMDNSIYLKYVIVDTECEYELLFEMGDI